MKSSKVQVVLGIVSGLVVSGSAQAALITNGDFENSTSGNWNGWVETRPANTSDSLYLEDGTGGSGQYLNQTFGNASKEIEIADLLDPVNTKFAAVDSETAGSNALYQVFTLPSGNYSSMQISFDFFARNHWNANVVGSGGLDNSSDASQFARVDILESVGGGVFVLSGPNLVANLYSSVTDNDINTNFPSSPNLVTWENRSLTIYGSFQGSYVFRIAEVDSLNTFQFGVDNIEVNVIPEPASMALLSLGGLLMLRRRRA